MKKNITLQISGGLGNQMFQYATAIAVAKKNNYELYMNLSSYIGYKWLETCDFDEQLGKLLPDIKIKKYFYEKLLAFPQPTRFIAKIIMGAHKIILNYYDETKEFSYDKNINNIKPNTCVKGFFQSYKYFEDNKNEIQQIYGDFPLSKSGEKILSDIKKQKQSIALHYREYTSLKSGDTEIAKVMGEMDIDYYKKGIEIIRKKHPSATINVFSNNIAQAKKVLKSLDNIKFIEYDILNSWEDMMLMKHCHHNIIANSSYSWWSAYLNQNPNKIVVAPKSWGNILKGRENDNDLFPNDWISI